MSDVLQPRVLPMSGITLSFNFTLHYNFITIVLYTSVKWFTEVRSDMSITIEITDALQIRTGSMGVLDARGNCRWWLGDASVRVELKSRTSPLFLLGPFSLSFPSNPNPFSLLVVICLSTLITSFHPALYFSVFTPFLFLTHFL